MTEIQIDGKEEFGVKKYNRICVRVCRTYSAEQLRCSINLLQIRLLESSIGLQLRQAVMIALDNCHLTKIYQN